MHSAYPWLVAAPVFGLATYSLSHLLLARSGRWVGPYPPLVFGFVPGLIVLVACSAGALRTMQAGPSDVVGYGLLNVVTYAALGWGYFHFVNMGIASLRIRMLRELEEAGGCLDRDHLLTGYNTAAVVELRISRLTSGGHLAVRDGRYFRGKLKFLLAARCFDLLRRFLFGPAYRPLPSDCTISAAISDHRTP